jgi:hypothetical protein
MEGEIAVVDSHIGGRVNDPGVGGLSERQGSYRRADDTGPM